MGELAVPPPMGTSPSGQLIIPDHRDGGIICSLGGSVSGNTGRSTYHIGADDGFGRNLAVRVRHHRAVDLIYRASGVGRCFGDQFGGSSRRSRRPPAIWSLISAAYRFRPELIARSCRRSILEVPWAGGRFGQTGEMSEEKRPVGEVLRGLSIGPLPDGWTAVDAYAMVKCLDPTGRAQWALRVTETINEEELLGALTMHVELLKRDMLDNWDDED